MTAIVIDDVRALELLRAAVQERGEDYVYDAPSEELAVREEDYTRCVYWFRSQEKPGCLVGDALFRAGVPRDILNALQGTIGGVASTQLNDYGAVQFRNNATTLLHVAQRAQDDGFTWGRALEQAEEYHHKHIAE